MDPIDKALKELIKRYPDYTFHRMFDLGTITERLVAVNGAVQVKIEANTIEELMNLIPGFRNVLDGRNVDR